MAYNTPKHPQGSEPEGTERTNGKQISSDTRSNLGRRGSGTGNNALPQQEEMPKRTPVKPNSVLEKEY